MRGPNFKHSPPESMSALDPEFQAAYRSAQSDLMAAVLAFEKTTGRFVDSISIGYIDVTRLMDMQAQYVRQADVHFLPKKDEV